MTPENLAILILGIVGALMALAFKYVPALQTWYDQHPNKGLIMLGLQVVVAGVYFALACTPWAIDLGISLTCTQADAFVVIKALFIMATGNQLTYLYTRRGPAIITPARKK